MDYRTSNTGLAATLLTLGFPLRETQKDSLSGKVYFTFPDMKEEVTESFFNRELLVDPRTFLINLRQLHDQVNEMTG